MITRRQALAGALALPVAAAVPAIAAPVEAVAVITAPSPEMWVAAYNAACRQALQDIAIYGRSMLHFPEGGLPYAVDALLLMRGPVEPA